MTSHWKCLGHIAPNLVGFCQRTLVGYHEKYISQTEIMVNVISFVKHSYVLEVAISCDYSVIFCNFNINVNSFL